MYATVTDICSDTELRECEACMLPTELTLSWMLTHGERMAETRVRTWRDVPESLASRTGAEADQGLDNGWQEVS